MPLQARLPKHLGSRTTYKPGIAGGQGSSPYILVKAQGDEPEEQLNLLEDLLQSMATSVEVNTRPA